MKSNKLEDQKNLDAIFYPQPLVDNLLICKKTIPTACPIFDTESNAIINPERITAINNFNCLDKFAIEYEFINCMLNHFNCTNQLNNRLQEFGVYYGLTVKSEELNYYLELYVGEQKKDIRRRILETKRRDYRLIKQDKRGNKSIHTLPYAFSSAGDEEINYKGVVKTTSSEFFFQFPKMIWQKAIENKYAGVNGENFIQLPSGIIGYSKIAQNQYKKDHQNNVVIQPENIHRAILFGGLKRRFTSKNKIEVKREELIKCILPNLIANHGSLNLKVPFAPIIKQLKETLTLVRLSLPTQNHRDNSINPITKSIYLGNYNKSGVIYFE